MATVVSGPSDDFDVPSEPILTGKLKNSEYLNDLPSQFSYLSDTPQEDLVKLLRSHLSLFSDTSSRTHMIEHDIEVADALPVRQCAYRLPMEKRQRMEKEVEYLLQHG